MFPGCRSLRISGTIVQLVNVISCLSKATSYVVPSRQLWEKQALDTSCPQFVLPESVVKSRRRPSDDVFREEAELARNNGKDTRSNSGSDSGMGFSETASEHNINAVMPAHDDVTDDVIPDDVNNKRSSLDPKMYLEASYVENESQQKLNPSDYLSQSAVNNDQPTTGNPKVYQNEPSRDKPSKASSSKDSRSKKSKKQYWEILDEPTPIPQSPKGILYAPSLQPATTPQSPEGIQYAPSLRTNADQRRSGFRSSRQLVSNTDPVDFQEPMDNDPSLPSHEPDLPIKDPVTPTCASNENINNDSEVILFFIVR